MSFTVTHYDNDEKVMDNATKEQVIEFLLAQGEMDYGYHVTEWDNEEVEEDGTPLLLEQLAGDEWLNDYL